MSRLLLGVQHHLRGSATTQSAVPKVKMLGAVIQTPEQILGLMLLNCVLIIYMEVIIEKDEMANIKLYMPNLR
jgi:hypothetical protein